METFREYAQAASNMTGAIAGQIINQLDPQMKAQWEKIVTDFPKLYAFLGDLHKASNGSWKVTPAQFTSILTRHITGVTGAKGIAQTAPLTQRQ